jgi:hypothetical protein
MQDEDEESIASTLLPLLINDARSHFRALHRRTHDPVANAFCIGEHWW